MATTKIKDFIKEPARVKEYIRDIKDLLEDRSLGLADIKEVMTVVEGVTKETEYGYYGVTEGVTRKDAGCGMEPVPFNIPVRTGWWDPKPLRVNISQCYADFEKTILQWCSVNGIDKLHIEDDHFVMFIAKQLEKTIHTDFNKFAYFGDTQASNVGSGSGNEQLTAGVAKENYNVLNGLFASFQSFITSDPSKRVTITENAQSTRAAQLALARDTAFKACTELLDKADGLTFASGSEPIFFMTYSMATNLSRYLRSEYKNEGTLTKMENGYETMTFEGLNVVTHRWIDEIIKRDFSDGTKWNNPHRIILLDKSECQLGVDSLSSLSDLEVEYVGGKDEHVYIKSAYRMDFQRVMPTTGAMAI